MKSVLFRFVSPWLATAALTSFALAATDDRPVVATPLAGHVYCFQGTTTNSAALVGAEGVLLVDSGERPEFGPKLRAALAQVSPTPVRLLVNTHWHFDHVNGNGTFAAQGATIIGHTAMRARAASQPRSGGGAPLSAAELPVVTFTDELTLHLNGEDVRLLHPRSGAGHTDGDTMVLFPQANVAHLGDLYFAEQYPYIDAAAGGSAAGMARAIREILPLLNDETKVVPGHGPITTKAQLAEFATMLEAASERVSALMAEGKTLEQIRAAQPTAALDARWGRGYFKPEQFVEFVYQGLVGRKS